MLVRKKSKSSQKEKSKFAYLTSRKESMENNYLQVLEKAQKRFTSQYGELVPYAERLKQIQSICEMLTEKYDAYDHTKDFIQYLRATNEVFERTRKEDLSVEQTRAELIKWEIQLISQDAGTEKDILEKVSREFSHAFSTSKKISVIAEILHKKYGKHEHFGAILYFIGILKDYYLIFDDAIEQERPMRWVEGRVISAHIANIAHYSDVPQEVLISVYEEFRVLAES